MGEAESLAADVARALGRLDVPFMLVGAAALAVRGVTRGSHDIDFLTMEASVLSEDWTTLIPAPASVETLRGDFDDPLRGTVRFSREGASPVDLVVGKWTWQRDIIDQSDTIDLGMFAVKVPSAADLVLLKIDAGSHLDRRDAAQLIDIEGPELIDTIEQAVADSPAHLQTAWRFFLRELHSER